MSSMLIRLGALFLIGLTSCSTPTLTSDGESLVKLSTIELASGQPEAALATVQTALRSSPRNSEAWLAAGNAQLAIGQPELANASFTRALIEDPGSVPGLLGLARVRLARDPSGASSDLKTLADSHPHDARVWTDLGVAYDLQSLPGNAQAAYRRAMTEDPLSQSAQANLGLSLALSGHAGEAVNLLKPLASSPQASAILRHNYAVAAALTGDENTARTVLGMDMSPSQVLSAVKQYAAFGNAPSN